MSALGGYFCGLSLEGLSFEQACVRRATRQGEAVQGGTSPSSVHLPSCFCWHNTQCLSPCQGQLFPASSLLSHTTGTLTAGSWILQRNSSTSGQLIVGEAQFTSTLRTFCWALRLNGHKMNQEEKRMWIYLSILWPRNPHKEMKTQK